MGTIITPLSNRPNDSYDRRHQSGLRAKNVWGLLAWQFNEVWPTGGWGSIEAVQGSFSNVSVGNLIGGRWKSLQYALRDHLYQDWFVSCGAGDSAQCFIRCVTATLGTDEILVQLELLNVQTDKIFLIFKSTVAVDPFAIKWL